MKYVLIVLVVILTGCAQAKTTYLPDGQTGYSINCSGTMLSWGACFEKAGALCGAHGYSVISRNGETGALALPQSSNGVFATTTATRTMLVACGAEGEG